MMNLSNHRYGKSRVRVMKVLRDGPTHTIKELEVAVALSGDFGTSYTEGDNQHVVATDTIKNTINVLAKKHLGTQTERFALHLAQHFLSKYAQVESVEVSTSETVWDPLLIGGKQHPHSFQQATSARPTTQVIATRSATEITSGIQGMVILKSAGSGFSGFPRDEFTTLPETEDRILATSMTATWQWSAEPQNYPNANRLILAAMLPPFAENFSPSVQTTMFQMGEAALSACAEISQVHLAMPNKHCLLINLAPFGMDNQNELFVPTDEPHGQIEATIARG